MNLGVDSKMVMHIKTRNRPTFCGTWYLPRSQVDNERTVPVIMAGVLRVQETAIFPLSLLNMT